MQCIKANTAIFFAKLGVLPMLLPGEIDSVKIVGICQLTHLAYSQILLAYLPQYASAINAKAYQICKLNKLMGMMNIYLRI